MLVSQPDVTARALWKASLCLHAVNRLTASALENHPAIAGATCNMLAIQILEQGDGIFPRDASEIFERRHVDSPPLLAASGMLSQFCYKHAESFAMEEEITADSHYHPPVDQELQELAAPFAFVHGNARAKHRVLDSRRFQARFFVNRLQATVQRHVGG